MKSIVVKTEVGGIYNDCILPKRVHHEFPGKNSVAPICREEHVETIDHLVSPMTEHKNRHNIEQYNHWKICQHYSTSHIEK